MYHELADDSNIQIFKKYEWGLKRLGVPLNEEIQDVIFSHLFNMESPLRAFCSWVLYKKQHGETFTEEQLELALKKAFAEQWEPSIYQENYLNKNIYILDSPSTHLWKIAEKILGNNVRNKVIADITDQGKVIFRENFHIGEENMEKIQDFIKNCKLYQLDNF